MSPRALARLVAQNVGRNRRAFALSAFGLMLGIASFSFFLALGAGVRRVVLGDVFPADRIEVVPARTGLAARVGLLGPRRLDDEVLRALRERPEVVAAYAKMRIAFPARLWGGKAIFGKDMYSELIGDGVDPSLVDGEVAPPYGFHDYEAADAAAPRCRGDADCSGGRYCPWDLRTCQRPVPAIVSRHLIELYNGSVAAANGLPRIGDWLASRFRGFTFQVELGRSFLSTAPRGVPHQRRFQLVGVSDKAIPIGITVPIGYVRRWNAEYGAAEAAEGYSSLVVRVRSKSDVTGLVAAVEKLGFDTASGEAEQAGLFITLVTAVLLLVSAVIVTVAAVNIAHVFFTQVTERRREFGVLRAVGASRRDVRALVLGEASLVGAAGSVLGLGVARLAALGVDALSARYLPDFPYKPVTYFEFGWPLVAGALAFGTACAVLGALWPARRAARMEPASALAAR